MLVCFDMIFFINLNYSAYLFGFPPYFLFHLKKDRLFFHIAPFLIFLVKFVIQELLESQNTQDRLTVIMDVLAEAIASPSDGDE